MGDSSLCYWFPLVKDLDIPIPKTEIIEIRATDRRLMKKAIYGEEIHENPLFSYHLKEIGENLKYPLFMRTDQSSGKHEWVSTCYIETPEDLETHIYKVVEENMLDGIMGLPWVAIVLREYIPMASQFTAFRGLPISPERRYFAEGGKIICHHPYWVEDAIGRGFHIPSLPQNWRELLKEMNTETEEEIELLSGYTEKISERLEGAWSVDFCKAKDGRWIFIDMAEAEISWHPECSQKKEN